MAKLFLDKVMGKDGVLQTLLPEITTQEKWQHGKGPATPWGP